MRCFFALPVDGPAATDLLAQAAGRFPADPALVWQTDSQLHITLAFVGEYPATGLPLLRGCAAALENTPRPRLEVAAPAWFPSPRRARALVLELHPDPTLMDLQQRLRQRLLASGVELEARVFRPHLTLARRRGRGRSAAPLSPWQPALPAPARFELWRSDRDRHGARYTVLAAWPFTPGPATGPGDGGGDSDAGRWPPPGDSAR